MQYTALNVALPLFIIEWWYVLLALIGVVIIESAVISYYISLLFCLILSLAIESRLIRKYAGQELNKRQLSKGVLIANHVSYVFLSWWLLWRYTAIFLTR